ncbi:hypothetical protein T492DRAFT_863033 [Pavlovales sp. CCMP2436]|nr:hypothetical protein T492DRAFT_863033 [Pavlovales sp. CCMP2436]
MLERGMEREEAAFQIFSQLDQDHDGSIDGKELGGLLRNMAIVSAKMPQHAIDAFVATQLALADDDASGRLSFEEFIAYYNSIVDLSAPTEIIDISGSSQ